MITNGNPLAASGSRPVDHLEVQVRGIGVTRVAQCGYGLPRLEFVARLHADASGLQVRIQRVISVSEVLHDVVARVLVQRKAARRLAWNLFGQVVDDRNHLAVADRVDRRSEIGVALQFGRVAGEQPEIVGELDVVDREPFRDHSLPLIGLAAIRCAVMSQHPLAFNQFGPSSGGEIDTGLCVDTVTGATSWVTSEPTSPGTGLATVRCTEWVMSVGTGAPPSTTTSSQTIAV